MRLIFVPAIVYENILTTKISQSTVYGNRPQGKHAQTKKVVYSPVLDNLSILFPWQLSQNPHRTVSQSFIFIYFLGNMLPDPSGKNMLHVPTAMSSSSPPPGPPPNLFPIDESLHIYILLTVYRGLFKLSNNLKHGVGTQFKMGCL